MFLYVIYNKRIEIFYNISSLSIFNLKELKLEI